MKKINRRSKQRSVSDSPSPSSIVDNKKDHDQRVRDLEIENEALKREIEELRYKVVNVSPTSDVGAQKLKDDYCGKSNSVAGQVVELKKKLDVLSQLSSKRVKTADAANNFQDEIRKLKAQKVQLQCRMKLESMQFRLCKASLEKEILQLKKEQRRKGYKMHVLLALNQRQKHVLQRKTEEAFMVRKQLKERLESRKAASRKISGTKNGKTVGIQGHKHGLDVKVQLPKVGTEYEHQMREMADEIKKLELESEMIPEEKSGYTLPDDEVAVTELELRDLREEMTRLNCLISQMNMSKTQVVEREKKQVHEVQSLISAGSEVDAVQSSLSAGSDVFASATDASETERSEGVNNMTEKPASGVCCSCSKKSLCKTLKCGCRAFGSSCGASCGCAISKCTNRDQLQIKLDCSPQSEMADNIVNSSGKNGEVKSTYQDKTLPETKVGKKDPKMNEDFRLKKQPLRDIGNITNKHNAGKPSRTKKVQKSVISS
ncbi:hypothetical protein SLE2022_114960 [Rubroshorea leprosula]